MCSARRAAAEIKAVSDSDGDADLFRPEGYFIGRESAYDQRT